jgi:acetyl esterase/lipase
MKEWGMLLLTLALAAYGEEPRRELVEEITLGRVPGAERFVSTGDCRAGKLGTVPYLETSDKRGSRFGVRFHLPDASPLWCFEWDWPDDKARFADVIVQPSDASSPNSKTHCEGDCHNYQLQVGYLTGSTVPVAGKIRTERCLYWAETQDVSVVFAALRANAPAAAAAIRLYKVTGPLPSAEISEPPAVDGWRRTVALHYEDTSIGYGFGTQRMPSAIGPELLDRLVSYLRFTGTGMLVYPVVWYNGSIDKSLPDAYVPRPKTVHPEGFMNEWLTRFDKEGIGFQAEFNLMDSPALRGLRNAVSVTNGTLYSTCALICNDGKASWQTGHLRSPSECILHPAVQQDVLRWVDAIIEQGKSHPSFKGINFRLAEFCCLWLGNIYAGYNDYMVEGFERDTGIHVPDRHSDPLRGKARYDWLMANAREPWTAWRCRELAKFYKAIAARLATARPDLRLTLSVLTPLNHAGESSYADAGFVNRQNRQGGLDAALFADTPNIVIAQGLRPMRYEAGYDRSRANYDETFFRNVFETEAYYESLSGVRTPWVYLHDHYFETAFGDPLRAGNSVPPLTAPWYHEQHWRVTTINPAGCYGMKPYIVPFRYHDVLGITRGGFLIGTYGMEDVLVPFVRAFRALPAVEFETRADSTPTVIHRSKILAGTEWFYVVNTTETPADFVLTLPEGATAIDLLTGKPAAGQAQGKLSLKLAPYEFRSFKANSREVKDIAYTKAGGNDHLGDLLLPSEVRDGTPVLLAIHGGGWSGGDRASWAGVAEFFRSQLGFAVFNIEYRLAKDGQRWPACGDDCVEAARFLLGGELGRRFGIAPKKVWICGGSAGGHLALWTGLSLPAEQVAGIVSISGIGDLAPDYAVNAGRYHGLFGRKPTPEEISAAAPLSLIKKGGPRILCTHAKEDKVVPFAAEENFCRAYREAGNTCRLFRYGAADEPNEGGHFIWRPGSKPHRLLGLLENAIADFVREGKGK